jgi:hypothetical protein
MSGSFSVAGKFMSRFISVVCLVFFVVLPALAQQQQPDWDKVQIKLEKLDDHVYLVQGRVLDRWSYIAQGPRADNYIERIYKSLITKSKGGQ